MAVSRGKVTMSAMHAAAPALAIFTPSGGGTSEGLSPTMFDDTGEMHTEIINPNRQPSNHTGFIRSPNKMFVFHDGASGYTHVVDLLSYWADSDRPDYNPYSTGMKGKMHLFLRIYTTAAGLPFFFMTSPERRYFEPLDTRVKSKSTDCQKVNVQFAP